MLNIHKNNEEDDDDNNNNNNNNNYNNNNNNNNNLVSFTVLRSCELRTRGFTELKSDCVTWMALNNT